MKSKLVPALIVFCTLSFLWLVVLPLLVDGGIIHRSHILYLFLVMELMTVITLFLHHILCFGGFYGGKLATMDCVKNGHSFVVASSFIVYFLRGTKRGNAKGYLLRDQNGGEQELAFKVYESECVEEKFFYVGDVIQKRNGKWRKVDPSESQVK